MEEKEFKNKFDTASEKSSDVFTANQVGVLIESFQNQFKAFGEGLEALREQVNLIALNQAKMLKRIERIEDRLTCLPRIEKRLDELEKRMEALEKFKDFFEKRMDSFESQMNSLQKEVKQIRAILEKAPDAKEIVRLEKRVATLEKKFAYLEAR